MSNVFPDDMIVGQKYQVIYQIRGVHRGPRIMVGTFLGKRTHPEESFAFNCRPAAGTQELRKEHFDSIEEVDYSTPNEVGRKVEL